MSNVYALKRIKKQIVTRGDTMKHTLSRRAVFFCAAALGIACAVSAQTNPPASTNIAAAAAPLNAADKCLTGNATGALAARNLAIPGAYTYYDGLTDSEFFPSWTFDKGYSAGWVPFADGTITDGKPGTSLLWPHYWLGGNGIDIVFDLKGEYVISSVKIQCAAEVLGNVGLSLKSANDPRYTLVAMNYDPFLPLGTNAPPKPVKECDLANVNASAQWVRVHLPNSRSIHLGEIQIWGYPLPAGQTFPKKPLTRGEVVVKKPGEVPFQNADDLIVFPIPQEMKRTGGDFVLSAATPILHFPVESERCRTTAEALRDEIARETGLKLEVRGADSDKVQNGAIVIVEPKALPAGMKPEGYAFVSGGEGVFISGADAAGAFYGTQTLLQLLRNTSKGWAVAGVNIRDWPECPIRLIQGRRAMSESLVRSLARFKINYYQIYSFNSAEKDSQFVPLAEKYFVKLMLTAEPRMLIGKNPEFAELNPGENLNDLEQSRVNFCPSHPKLWETYFGEVDKWIDKFNSDYVSINFDEMYQSSHGARWNVCKYCRARNMHAWELLGWTLNNINEHFAKHGKKIFMLDTCFYGPSISNKEDTDKDWRKALDIIPTNILMGVWHPKEVNKLFSDKGIPQVRWVNNPNGKGEKFPATTVEGARYAGMCVNMLDGPFSYRRFISMPQECWSPGRAYSADELGGLAMDTFMPYLRYVLDGAGSPAAQADPSRFFTVDLKSAVNSSFTDEMPGDGKGWFDMGPNFDLRSIRPGRRELGGVPFDIIEESKNGNKGCLVLYNRGYMNPDMPAQSDFDIGRKAASLLFLHTIMQDAGQSYLRKNEHAGFYFIVYDDDTYSTFDIKYSINILPWLGGERDASGNFRAPMPLKRGRLAWRGETIGGRAAYLFYSEWINPRPDKIIRKVICRTAWKKSPMNLALIAVTGVSPAGNEPQLDVKLCNAADIVPAAAKGSPLDLRWGREESLQSYIAPDGTIVECSKPFRKDKYHAACHDFLSSAACAVYDGNHFFWPEGAGELKLLFPAPINLTGFMIRCPPRDERKNEDFGASQASWVFETSADGKTWQPAGKLSLREEQGPQFFALTNGAVKSLRISGSGVVGLTPYK